MKYIVVGLVLLTILTLSSTQSVPAYPCDVSGCQTCSYYNICGLCKNNYILQINSTTSQSYCAEVFCPENCASCLSNYTCQKCDTGYYVTSSGYCSQTVPQYTCDEYCLSCNSTTNCLLCQYGFNIQSGECLPNYRPYTNCLVLFSSDKCQICSSGYLATIAYSCQQVPGYTCNVTNCFECYENNKCGKCLLGYSINENSGCTALTCSIQNCTICQNAKTCLECASGFTLNDNVCSMNIYPCDIPNCKVCSAANTCSGCVEGYQVVKNNSKDDTVGAYCSKYTVAVGNNAEFMSNCAMLGSLPFGTDTILQVGCIKCNTNFVNVGGMCLANLTLTNYTCNVQNCVFCSQNNYCGQCGQGYYVQLLTGGICTKMYSPLPNCQLTTLFAPICLACEDGYALDINYQCAWMTNMTCNVDGCSYCLSQNACYQCRVGFNQIDNNGTITCEAKCNVTNCYQCSGTATCGFCDGGYILNDDNDQCTEASQVSVNCSSLYPNCEECNALYCKKCSSGFNLNNATNTCCTAPLQNRMGCAVYEDACSNDCLSCSLGYYKFLGTCITLPCSIDNCAYCFRSNTCQLCSEGYTLSGNTCTKYTKPTNCTQANCASCNDNGTCKTCITGYLLYNGVCVCNFQNCLSCMGDGFCKVCAFPTVQTYINSAGCLPSISVVTLCNVANCVNCKVANQCSECDLGYTLQSNGTCLRNPCDSSSNCLLCSNDRNFCFTCKQGYIQSNFFGSSCIQIAQTYECEVQGCAVCNTSTTCETCIENHQLTSDKQCERFKCVDNCLVCFQNSNCTLCNPGYYFTTDNTCVKQDSDVITCTIDYCIACSEDENSTEICNQCDFGLAPTTDKLSCTPASCSSPNCQLCFESFQFVPTRISACFICQQGYFLNSYFQCVKYSPAINTPPCDVYNCLYCHYQNQCAFCLVGWNETDGICQTNLFCDDQNCDSCTNATYCVSCATKYKNSLGVCQPQCNISDCVTCATLETCDSCVDTFVLSDDSKSCACKETYVSINNTCVCASNSTEFQGVCYTCNVTNCSLCEKNNVCSTCNTTYYLKDSKCSCPDDTFEVVDGLCKCPSGKLSFGTGADQTCIACNITYCSSCSSVDNCDTCQATFELGNNTCACPDTTFEIQSNVCACPTDFKEYDKTCIECKIDYCSYCQATNSCNECVDSFTLVSSTSCECATGTTFYNDFCYTCNVQYCKTCNATDTCFECDASFNVSGTSCVCVSGYTLYDSTCIQCNVTNCSMCQEANNCSTCASEYTNANGKCITCNVRGCQQCETPNYCKTCFNNEQISSVGTCISCKIAGCSVCENNATCVSCNDGLVFNSNKTTCLNCSITGCETCSANNTCLTCLPGFTLSSGQCTVCAQPCLTCNSNGTCATCMTPFSNTASNGTCYKCNLKNCFQCPTATSSTCTTCATGYQLSSNKQCTRICGSVFCTECSSSTNCTKCISGYTPSGAGCKVCAASNCLSCLQTSPTVCTKCAQGYYLEDGTCSSCASSNCETCNSTTCLTFKKSTGQKPFINNQGQITPVLCNLQCNSCSDINPQICLICKPGYALQNGNCISCQAPCKTCADNSPTTCLSCYGNAFLSNDQCKICTPSSNCLTCQESNLTQCTTCPYGFSLGSNSTCVKGCPSFCLSCSNSSFCDVCQSGFSANAQGACLPCLSNCRDCSGTSQGVCLSCGDGFYLNANSVCESCSQYCITCTPQYKCQGCYSGYTLTSSFTCAKTCNNPCATCSQTNSSACFSCIGGYNYDSTKNTCTQATNCTGGVCDICPFGYTLSGGNCIACNSTCARCESTSSNTCTSCYDGNYLSTSNKCVACAVGCKTCSSGTNCLSCEAGYTYQSSPVLTTITCVKCSGYCSECLGSASTCTACEKGYVLNGWTCLSSFNYGFNTTLNATLATFYNNYEAFLKAIAETVNSTSVNTVTITNITEGSVVVNGNVTTTASTDSNDAQNQFNSLGSVLSQGASIANMPIISSSIDANGGQIPSSSSGPNLAIILGVCIPVGVILIGLLIYCCCVRKSSPPQSDYSQKNMEPGTTVRQTFELSRDNTQRIQTVEVKEEEG